MKKIDLANRIIEITKDLETAYVSEFNKNMLTKLRDAIEASGEPAFSGAPELSGEVDEDAVRKAEDLLKAFLNETWTERPDAHKYVIGSCLAQAFLFEQPMHPKEKVQYLTRVEDGKERYYCSYNERGTVCDFCAAAPIDELKEQWVKEQIMIQNEWGEESALVQETILETGFQEAGVILTEKLSFHEDVRKLCEENQCRCYGTTWACPPAVGSLEECKERVLLFKYLHLFSKVYVVEDFMDMSGFLEAMKDFKVIARALDKKLRGKLEPMQILSNESCDRCKTCTYPDEPCRFPDELHHSIEGYGFYVSELAELAGIKYMNGENTVTFFGAVLY